MLGTLSTLRPSVLRAAAWTFRALTVARRHLRVNGIDPMPVLPGPPGVGADAFRGVAAVLRRRDATCLERSLVLQRWLAAHGDRRELVIGVKGPRDEFGAHAWLEGEPPTDGISEFKELLRRPAPES